MSRWNDIADQVVEFSKWWKEYTECHNTDIMSQETCAIAAFKAGHEYGFRSGQENMLEAGYKLPED